jgi:MFS family permease
MSNNISPLWGYVSDKIGRRPVLLMGVAGTTIGCFTFGFSKWYWMAIVCRLFYGLFNGNLGVVKTYIRESTDKTNQARAFSIIGVTFGVSVVLGPLIGGFLALPAKRFPLLFNNWFFVTFPYALPNLVLTGVSLFTLVFGYFFLIETRNFDPVPAKVVDPCVDPIDSVEDPESVQSENNEFTHDTSEKVSVVVKKRWWRPRSWWISIKTSPIITTRAPMVTCLLYALIGLGDIIFQSIIPLWMWTPIAQKGLGFDTWKIGVLNVGAGLVSIPVQLFISPWLNNKIGIRNTFFVTAAICVPTCFVTADLYLLVNKEWLIWILLPLSYCLRISALEVCYCSIMMMINNSVSVDHLGTVNGIAQSLVAFTRTVGPALGSSLFALSITVDFFLLFDVHFTFFLTGVLTILLIPLGFFLPKSINDPQK